MAISVSGSKARLSILLVANLLLLGLGIALIALGSILIGSYLLNHLSFASGLFHATPILIIIAGIATVIVSMYGLVLWKRQQEISSGLRFFSILLFLAFLLCVIACILSFLLREVAAVHFPSTNVLAQIRRFFNNEDIRTRWNALQRGYECCGGHQQGYRDWTPNSGILRAVPDSCCKREFEHCGERVNFNQELAIPRVDSVIHVMGCMPVIKSAMRNKVLPILMACALMALVAGLIELLLMLCAYCFADHVKKIKDVRRSQMSLERGQTPPWRNPSRNPSPRLKVPVLDASPSLKQNRFFFQNQSDSPEPPSQIEGSLDESSSHYARIHSPENKKSGWFSNCFGKKKTSTVEPRAEMDPMHRRKEALYNDALDREHTLMGVLKNVSAPPSEINDEDQVETAPTAHPPSTKRGFSFFGFRSKSRDNVLSSDSKLNNSQGDGSTTSQQVRDMKALSLDNLHKKDSDTSRGFFAFFSKSKERLHEDGNKRRRNSDTPKGGSHLKERSQSHDEMRSNQQKLKLPSWLSSQPKRGDTVDDRPGDVEPGFDEVDLKTPEANVEMKKDEANGLKKLRSKWAFQPKTSAKQGDRDGNPLVEEDRLKSDRFGDTSKAIISRGVSPALADRIETLEVEHENEEDEEVKSVEDPPVTTVDVSTSPKESRKLGTPSWLLARGQSVDALDRSNHIEQDKREEDTLQSSSISLPHRKPTVIGSNEDILDYVNRRPSVGNPVRVESPLDKNLTSDEWEGDSRVRLSGFGLNKLEGSKRESQTRSPNSRPVLASDDERISQIEMEIDTNKKSPKKKVSYAEDTPKLDSDELPNVIRPTPKKSKSYLKIKMPTFGRHSQTKAHDSPTPEHETDRRELASQVTSSGGSQQSDHDFMKHINKSGYNGDTKLPTPLVEGKWKEDKVARVDMSNPYEGNWSEMDEKSPQNATYVEGTRYQTPQSLTKDPSRRRSGPYSAVYEDRQTPSHAKTGTQSKQSKQGRRASESSISSGSSSSNGSRSPADDDPNRKVDLAKLKSPQFYLDKKDGRILAAFETEPQKKRRGRSVDHLDQGDDDMYLPFGTTEYWIHEVDKKLEENEKHQRTRTRSEPRISKRSERRTSRDEVQSDRDRGIQSSDRFGRTKRRVIPHGPKGEPVRNIKSLDRNRGRDFRTSLEVEAVEGGGYRIRRASEGVRRPRFPSPEMRPRHVSVTTLQIRHQTPSSKK